MLDGRKTLLDGRRSIVALGVGMTLAIMGFGVAIAQDDSDTSGGDDAEVSTRRRVQLTPEEQVAEAGRLEERGTNISRRVLGMLDEARRERDIIRVTCLNDKLTQINAHRRTLESRSESLQEAVNTADEGRRNHEFTVISVLGQQFTTLESEAGACIGQDLFETGSTRVVTDVDPAAPEEQLDFPEPPGDPGDLPFIPPAAS